MKTSVFNNLVIARDSAAKGSKSRGNLFKSTSEISQGDRFVDYFDNSNSNFETPREDGHRSGYFAKMIIVGLMTLLLSPLSLAQNFDTNRMNRDIKIMENILGEMFKTQFTTKEGTGTIQVRSQGYTIFGSGSSGNVKGTYIPGYGVIFMIPSTSNRYSIVSRKSSDRQIVFQYSSDDNDSDRSIDKESVTNRISEFLQDYASTIGQLKNDESILVIYGSANSTGSRFAVYNLQGDEEDKSEPLPVISVSAKKSDLEAYRAGRLNTDAFKNRLSVSTSEDKERLDLKVLGNIFGTALGDGDGNQYHLINSNSLSYMYLDNFGALYSLDLHRGHGLGSNVFELRLNRDSNAEEIAAKAQESEKKVSETLEKEYDALVAKTKEFIVDYGRTLSSLNDDQYLLVSLNINDSSDIVPERVDFQVKKSTFNQLDRGQISREAALNAVTLTEY
ncbi:hypothetical protein [Gracilimonas sp.]|uniref:hypothetical protein n=1 Tax=Gracilimonas sp. TaxID=1974203 RepID=UPI0032EC460F